MLSVSWSAVSYTLSVFTAILTFTRNSSSSRNGRARSMSSCLGPGRVRRPHPQAGVHAHRQSSWAVNHVLTMAERSTTQGTPQERIALRKLQYKSRIGWKDKYRQVRNILPCYTKYVLFLIYSALVRTQSPTYLCSLKC